MKNIILTTIIALLLTGCSENLYERNKDCGNLYDKMKEQGRGTIVKTFYSKTLDSCLFETEEVINVKKGETVCNGMESYSHKRIYNYFTKEMLFDKAGCFGEIEYDKFLNSVQ